MLFRYFGTHAFETIRDRRLLTSKLSSFNDPFEFIFTPKDDYTDEEIRIIAQKRLKSPEFWNAVSEVAPRIDPKFIESQMSNPEVLSEVNKGMLASDEKFLESRFERADSIMRLICLSKAEEPENEILMWSHYGNAHKGWRLGFDFPVSGPKHELIDMKYEANRVAFGYTGDDDDGVLAQAFTAANRTKSLAWKYEQECRLFSLKRVLSEEELPTGERGCFFPFEADELKRVDLGMNSDLEVDQQIIDLVVSDFAGVEIYKARKDKSRYAVAYDRIT